MSYNECTDAYQPTLFLKHVDYRTHPDEIYNVLTKMGFGAVSNVCIRKPTHGNTLTTAVVKFHYWHTRETVNTREMLNAGKFLQIYYTDKYYWKVYAFLSKQRTRLEEDENHIQETKEEDEEQTLLKEILEFVEKKAREGTEGTPPPSPRTLFKNEELAKTHMNVVINSSTQTIKIPKRKA
jgi:hypothetical protein